MNCSQKRKEKKWNINRWGKIYNPTYTVYQDNLIDKTGRLIV